MEESPPPDAGRSDASPAEDAAIQPDAGAIDAGDDAGLVVEDAGAPDAGPDAGVPAPLEPEHNGWRWVQPQPTGNSLLVATSFDGELFAAGTAGVAYREGEGAWELVRAPDGRDAVALRAGEAGLFVAGRDGLVARWNGDRFENESLGEAIDILSLHVEDGVWAAGRAGRLMRRESAGGWTSEDSGTDVDLLFVGRREGNLIVGTEEGLRVREGDAWTPLPLPADARAVAYVSAGDTVFAATGVGEGYRYGGAGWEPFASDCGSRCPLALFPGAPSRPVLAILGEGFAARIQAYGADGTPVGPRLDPLGARGLTIHDGEITSVGLAGLTEHEDVGGSRLVYRGLGAPNLFATRALAIDGSRAYSLGAQSGTEWPLFTFDGTEWTESTVARTTTGDFGDLGVLGGQLILRDDGSAVRRSAGTWSAIPELAAYDLRSMSSSGSALWATTSEGEIVRLSDGGVLNVFDVRSSFNRNNRIAAGADAAYFLEGFVVNRSVFRIDSAGAVEELAVPVGRDYLLMRAQGDTVWLVDDRGELHAVSGLDYAGIGAVPLADGETPTSMAVVSPTRVHIGTSRGRVATWDGTEWSIETTASGVELSHLVASETLSVAASGGAWGLMFKRSL